MDQSAHTRHHKDHGHGQGIDLQRPLDFELPDHDPIGDVDRGAARIHSQRDELEDRDHKRQADRRAGHDAHSAFAYAPAGNHVDDQTQEREED